MVKKQSIKNKHKKKRRTQKGGVGERGRRRSMCRAPINPYLNISKRNLNRGNIMNENRIILNTLKTSNFYLYSELVAKIQAASVQSKKHPTPEFINLLIKQTITDYEMNPSIYHTRWQPLTTSIIEPLNTTSNVPIEEYNSDPLSESDVLALFGAPPVQEHSPQINRIRQPSRERTRSVNSKGSTNSKSSVNSKGSTKKSSNRDSV